MIDWLINDLLIMCEGWPHLRLISDPIPALPFIALVNLETAAINPVDRAENQEKLNRQINSIGLNWKANNW